MTPNVTRIIARGLLAAAVLGVAWLPAQNAAAVSKSVSRGQGAHAMTVCMLEDGDMRMNGDQVICCVARFCVACKDNVDCRVWSNKRLDSHVLRPKHPGGTANAPDPFVAPSQKDRNRETAPKTGVVD